MPEMGAMITCTRVTPHVRQPEIACAKRYRLRIALAAEPERFANGATLPRNESLRIQQTQICAECPHGEERLAKFDLQKIDKLLKIRVKEPKHSRPKHVNTRERVFLAIQKLKQASCEEIVNFLGDGTQHAVVGRSLFFLSKTRRIEALDQRSKARKWAVMGSGEVAKYTVPQKLEEMTAPGEWAKVPGYNGNYFASKEGEVWSKNKGRVMNTHIIYGVERIALRAPECRQPRRPPVADVIWRTFNGPPPKGWIVVNKNGCRSDNRLENLKLADQSIKKRPGPDAALDPDTIRMIRSTSTGSTVLGRKVGVCASTIRDIRNRKIYKWVPDEA